MTTTPHSNIINRVASEALKPIGVKRKGQSRTWLDDRGWWITIIEFQPSAWSKGTYLNVGINWQWYPREHFSFDFGHREAGFIEYNSDEQFEPEVRKFAELAKSKVLEIREKLSTPKSAKSYITESLKEQRPNLWNEFHQGMLCAIAGEIDEATSYFNQVLANPHDTEWARDLKKFTNNLVSVVGSGQDYYSYVNELVNESRKLKKLKETEIRLPKLA